MMEFVSWDDEIPNIWKKHVPNHQSVYIYIPIGSMYGIYANIGGILMVNVAIYGIHGIYGIYIYIYIHTSSHRNCFRKVTQDPR